MSWNQSSGLVTFRSRFVLRLEITILSLLITGVMEAGSHKTVSSDVITWVAAVSRVEKLSLHVAHLLA